MVNLSSFIRYHARRTPQKVAVIYQHERVTFAELLARIETMAGYLAARGIGPDDVVALLMKSEPLAPTYYVAAICVLGAITTLFFKDAHREQ